MSTTGTSSRAGRSASAAPACGGKPPRLDSSPLRGDSLKLYKNSMIYPCALCIAAAQHGTCCNAARNLILVTTNRPASGRAKKGTEHVARNHQIPSVLAALQCQPERALPARRPRTGRHRHHPIGHSAGRVGQRQPLISREYHESARPERALSFLVLNRAAAALAGRPGQREILDLDAQICGPRIERQFG